MAGGTRSSWRSWKTSGSFRAGRPLDEHPRLDDGWLPLLTFLTPGSSDPFIDGVLVRRHAWPNLRRGAVGVRVGVEVRVIVVLVQVLDGFLSELALQVIPPLPWGQSWVGTVGGAGGGRGAGGDSGARVGVRGLIGVLRALAVAEVLVRGRRVVVIDGHVLVVPDARVLLPAGPLAGLGHHTGPRRGRRGGRGQLLGDLCGFSRSFHWLTGRGGLLPQVIRVLVVRVLVVISLTVALSIWVVFIRVGVLRLGSVGDRGVTVRTVVLAVIVSCPVV